jgi:hypothetical protein
LLVVRSNRARNHLLRTIESAIQAVKEATARTRAILLSEI